jgi:integrase
MSSARIRYAYLKGQTWLYRRNYPKEVAAILRRQALKQSLKTSDAKVARQRAAEVNAHYEETVEQVLSGALSLCESGSLVDECASGWASHSEVALARLRSTLQHSEPVRYQREPTRHRISVVEAARRYLTLRQGELRPSGFKSVRYSVDLFASKYGSVRLSDLTREHGREFLSLTAQLSPLLGKSIRTQGLSLDEAVRWSRDQPTRITGRTQRRIWSQVNHWLDWCVYEGELDTNPFTSVRFEAKVRQASYAVPTDDEVRAMLDLDDPVIGNVLLVCLLSGMRAGEAAGLLREDLVPKGNLGTFFHVRPNSLRQLKTEAADRLVPVHADLEPVLSQLPSSGPLFPELKVNDITKGFSKVRQALGIDRPGLVFHSTRKWFITQCERTGVPEHFTASLVGHASARSGNGITYSIYSAGISDEQKRGIIDQIRLPVS